MRLKVHNRYTNEDTTKKIYVGNNDILKAYITTGLSIQEIRDKVANGYKINADGALIAKIESTITEAQIETEVSSQVTTISKENNNTSSSNSSIAIIVIITAIAVGFGIVLFTVKKIKSSPHKNGGDEV